MSPRIAVATLCLGVLACEAAPSAPEAGPTVTVAVVSGDAQTAPPGAELPEPVVAVVLDARGKPVQDQLVNFRVTQGGGSVFAGSALSDKDGLVRDWWTLGPEPGENVLEARAVDPATGAKLVYATFHATAEDGEPPPSGEDPLAGTWSGTRGDGVAVVYTFANAGRTEVNGRTGNVADVYAGTFSGAGSQSFTAWLEGLDLYFGVTSRGLLTGPNTLSIWSGDVEPFDVTRGPSQ